MKLSAKLAPLFVSFLISAAAFHAAAQCTTPSASQPSVPSGDEVLIDDALPSGATVSTGSVTFDTSQYATGSQSFVHNGAGTNTVRIDDLNQFFKFGSGKAVFYVLIDPCSTTREIRVTYRSNARTAIVYWGEKLIGSEPVQFRRGNLPSTGVWTRMEVPISSPLNLQGHVVESLTFETYDGRVWFDHVGTDGTGCTPASASAPSLPSTDTVWVDDDVPVDAYVSYGNWRTDQKASGTQSLAYPYFGQTPIGVERVTNMAEATSSGDNLVLYVMPTGCAQLNELMVTWYSDPWTSGSIYYGTTGIGGESSAVFMGSTVPAADTWTRIEIPAALIGLDGATIYSVRVQNKGSQVWVDRIGKSTP
ncbi:MAG TPA: hypothetical protein VND45_14000 [Thermoanaerobaculia bacterium]|jgi:hypothetical protein|nr:hypothetical protein [Thermoanaerobaculia bacterium]